MHPDVGGDHARYVEAVAAVEAEWSRRGGAGLRPRPTPPLHRVEIRRAAAWLRALRRLRRRVRRWSRDPQVRRHRYRLRAALRRVPRSRRRRTRRHLR